ncbi:unnamed protein product, partial [marine sediment metagenome]
ATSGGTSFDQYNTVLAHTKTYNPLADYGSGVLLGHPEHRGWNFNMKMFENLVDTDLTTIEPNFQLSQYQVYNNMVRTVQKDYPIHLWRKSENGMIIGNSAFDTTSTKNVVSPYSSPTGWDDPENIFKDNNLNLQASIGN